MTIFNLRRMSFAAQLLFVTIVFGAMDFEETATAVTLTVGADQSYKTPDEAIRVAQPGDTISIETGTYESCAVLTVNRLTVRGSGAQPVLEGPICEGKGIFVVRADDVTIQNIKFADAQSPEGNGAGIREEGTNLTVENSTFANDQDGILANKLPASTIVVRNSVFTGDGACVSPGQCAHGIYAGHIALLHVEGSRFYDTKIGHHIKSRALRTEIVGNTIEDGPRGTSSYLVDIPNGGTLLMTGNIIEKGPKSENHFTAIDIGEEGVPQPSSELLVQGNSFTNDGPPTVFVRNKTATPARLIDNVIRGTAVTDLDGPGIVK